MDPLDRLERADKWALGGGTGALYAPPFPRDLAVPGFWDECFFADVRLSRLFCVLLTDGAGRPCRFAGKVISWRPDQLVLRHEATDGVLMERRAVLETGAWVSELTWHGPEPLLGYAWSLPEVNPSGPGAPWVSARNVRVGEDHVAWEHHVAWPEELEPDRTAVEAEATRVQAGMRPARPVHLAVAVDRRLSFTVNLAQRHDESPRYELSVLPEKLTHGRLAGDFKPVGGPEPVGGLLHLVQQFELRPGVPTVVSCGAGLDPEAALRSARSGLSAPIDASERAWRAYFGGLPRLTSSDPFFENAVLYRWAGLRLNTVSVEGLPLCRTPQPDGAFAPFVTEGIGFFRNFVTYSSQAILREVAWMHDPALAVGILDNLVACQREDGSFPGHNYSGRPPRDFYHADFGTPMRLLHALHPGSVRREHLQALRRYADWLVRTRTLSADPAGPTLYDVFDQNETGQEYMARYQFASEAADRWASFRVSGIDATVAAALSFEAAAAFRAGDSPYRAFADGARAGLRHLAFDPSAAFFCDVRPDGIRSPARPLTGLYALLVDGVGHEEAVVSRWLPAFEGAAGFSAESREDATYRADGEWKEKRLNCPWNGRSWPMANSHLVEALTAAARRTGSPALRSAAGSALRKAVRLMFHDGDPSRPSAFEHYNPETGVAALYRGYDDYMHSWVVDLVFRHAVGVTPGSSLVDPLCADLDWIEVEDLPWAGSQRSVRVERGQVVREEVG